MEREQQSFWERFAAIDRRILYSIIFVLVGFIVLRPLGLPIVVSTDTQEYYDTIDSLPAGGVLWLDAGYGPGSIGELGPMMEATIRHALRNDVRVVMAAMWEQGGRMSETAWLKVAPDFPDKEYGEDIVNLGWRPGGAQAVLRSAVRDVYDTYAGVDHRGQSLDDMPLAMEVKQLNDEYVDFAVVYESGSPGGADWLQYVAEPTGLPMGIGIIAMSIPGAKAYYDAGQYKAMLPGSTGCAEYELLLNAPGAAVAAQDVLSISMLYVTLLIILGNIAWFATRET